MKMAKANIIMPLWLKLLNCLVLLAVVISMMWPATCSFYKWHREIFLLQHYAKRITSFIDEYKEENHVLPDEIAVNEYFLSIKTDKHEHDLIVGYYPVETKEKKTFVLIDRTKNVAVLIEYSLL